MSKTVETRPVCDRLAGSFGYPLDAMNPPPAEKKPNVLALALTTGCSHALCTFCTMYERGHYTEKSLPEFKAHVDQVAAWYESQQLVIPNRIFIGAGNALHVDADKLLEATQYALLRLKQKLGEVPRRLAMYGNTQDVLAKGHEELFRLRCGGVCGACSIGKLGTRRGLEVLYWGAESANDSALKLGGKGCTGDDTLSAAYNLRRARIRPSIMVMPGLGGEACDKGHVDDTAILLNSALPEWITFIGLTIWANTPYDRMMKLAEAKNTNRVLTQAEITEQTARMIEQLDIETTVGVHGSDVHTFGKNPTSLGAVKISDKYDARALANKLREMAGLSVPQRYWYEQPIRPKYRY